MLAFHSDPEIKQKYVSRVQAHAANDEITQEFYWQNGKGCTVDCTIHGRDYNAYEKELGISILLARLEDRIFEMLLPHEAKSFPLEFLQSINVGADLSLVWPKFAYWFLIDPRHGVKQRTVNGEIKLVVQKIADLFARQIVGDKPNIEEWRAAAVAAAANANASYDAAVAADFFPASAAASAAKAYATDVAAYVGDAAASAVCAADAARTEHVRRMRDKLLGLLRQAPVGGVVEMEMV